ncbi:MAG TPA: potassium/proton antiporter [Gemmatimonadales bacterium]|nr:potassium/proton antiporter [Gemmatimonadales bacterium]
MPLAEPVATAILLLAFGILLAISVIFSRATERVSVPVVLIFLVIGMLAGSEGIGGIEFDDYAFSYRLGTTALAFILFDGGLNTPMGAVRRTIRPAGLLATVGVVGIAALVGVAGRLFGFPWPEALLLGAIVSSTDAAAVFSVLRGSGLHLKKRVGATLEVESGLNDPMAVILTMELTAVVMQPEAIGDWWQVPIDVGLQLAIGAALGIAIGYGGRALITRIRLPAGGLYPALTLAIACIAFGVPTIMFGSGFLAVYVAGIILGNGELPYRAGLFRVHDALAWLSQIVMFLILGLLVYPSELLEVGWVGVGLAAVLAFIARPIVVGALLLPFRFPAREVAYIGWVGLRGAVPIVLATYPVLLGAPGAGRIFNVVFFIVVLSAIIPGSTVAWVTKRLGLSSREPPPPPAILAIESRQPLAGEIASYYVAEGLAVAGAEIADLGLPDTAAVSLIVRGNELIPPKENTVLRVGDHVYIVSRPDDRNYIQLLFGREEE